MKTHHIARYFSVAAALLLSACAHEWTPAELAALKAKNSDPCNYKQSGGGKCVTIWRAGDDAPFPAPELLLRR